MTKIRVTYYDGQSSKGNDAALLLLEGVWSIQYLDKNFNTQLVNWDVNQIESYQSSNKLIRFKYGSFPQQVIECSPEVYQSLAKEYPQIKIIDRNLSFILQKGTKVIIGLTFIFAGLVAGIYFFILPPLAEFIAGQIPMKYEKQLGESVYEQSIEYANIDDSLTYWVNDFSKQINYNTHYPIQITVIDDNIFNAYALPGGHIVIYTRILQEMENKEELAALLAHEVSHVHYRHSLKGISRSLSGYLFMSFLFSDISGITAAIAENSHALFNLTYSRALEEEADKKGLDILSNNHISQYGFVNLFERMKKEHKDNEFDKILSSHPLMNERITYTKEAAQTQGGILENTSLDDSWTHIKRLAGNPQ